MNMIVVHNDFSNNGNANLLRQTFTAELLTQILIAGLKTASPTYNKDSTVVAIPQQYRSNSAHHCHGVIFYRKTLPLRATHLKQTKTAAFSTISNARFLTQFDCKWPYKLLDNLNADIVMANIDETINPSSEKITITSHARIAGLRRFYANSALRTTLPADWPHHIFIRPDILNKLLPEGGLPIIFNNFLSRCRAKSLRITSVRISGTVLDLQNQYDFLRFIDYCLTSPRRNYSPLQDATRSRNHSIISRDARLFGKVILGKNVNIGPNTLIVGPTILCNNVKISKNAVVRASVIGPAVTVPQGQLVQHRVVLTSQHHWAYITDKENKNTRNSVIQQRSRPVHFRVWPVFSYPAWPKRVADIIIAAGVLILFAPIIPIIALAIKLTSRGPVFFRDKREGLHAKQFYCIKFRSMIAGAEGIQEKLRSKNQVDGPQFKITDDPRVSIVGKFLRDTYIDEIPQFVNVLLGQMSVVGPRPSPRAENSLSPVWREARLSVRPGITGLWQIGRTRRPDKDFQEWLYYDTKYVKQLSLYLDLSICCKTAKKLVLNFAKQF